MRRYRPLYTFDSNLNPVFTNPALAPTLKFLSGIETYVGQHCPRKVVFVGLHCHVARHLHVPNTLVRSAARLAGSSTALDQTVPSVVFSVSANGYVLN